MSHANTDLRQKRSISQIPQTFRSAVRRVQTDLLNKVRRRKSSIDNRPALPLPDGNNNKGTNDRKRLPSKEELDKIYCDDDDDDDENTNPVYDYPDVSQLVDLPSPQPSPPRVPNTARPTLKSPNSPAADKSKRPSDLTHVEAGDKEKLSTLGRKRSTYIAEKVKQFNGPQNSNYYVKPNSIFTNDRSNKNGISKYKESPHRSTNDTAKDNNPKPQITTNRTNYHRVVLSNAKPASPQMTANRTNYHRVVLSNTKPATAPKPIYIEPIRRDEDDRPTLKVSPHCRPLEESSLYSDTSFLELPDMSVDELCLCLKDCGLPDLAETCRKEQLDGLFIHDMSKEELQKELHLTPLHAKKIEMVKNGWRPLKK